MALRAASNIISDWPNAGPVIASMSTGRCPVSVTPTPIPLKASETTAVTARNHQVEDSVRSLTTSARTLAVSTAKRALLMRGCPL